MGFTALNLHDHILKAITDAGYDQPTPVQAQAVPAAIEGRDLLVSSQTGSGKTAAFMLPSLHKIAGPAKSNARGPRVLVLTPTRELALQVTNACQKYGRHLRYAKAVSIVGGVSYPVQNRLLAQRYEVLVATPGRLIDQMNSGRIDFGRLDTLILDEADRMLDMGFIDDIERIIERLPRDRQTLLFSATVDERIARLAAEMLNDPLRIEITPVGERHENIEQRLLYADGLSHKNKLLDYILRDADVKQAIVFTATKRDADQLAADLDEAGLGAAALHGDMGQGQRNRTLTQLRRGDLRVLVATDVAARGIDVNGISHVINFDLPKSVEDYVHRIGRTGRAGKSGIAISFANRQDMRQVKAIERFTRQTLPVHTIPGLEPKAPIKPDFADRRRGGGGGGGRGNGGGYRGDGGFRGNAGPRGGWSGNREGGRDSFREGQSERRDFNNGAPQDGAPRGEQGHRDHMREPGHRDVSFREGRFNEGRSHEGRFNENRPHPHGRFQEGHSHDAPRREGAPREGGYRDGGFRRDGDSRPAPQGDRKPYGERKPFGERADRGDRGERRFDGDRRPFGERREPSGDRPQRNFGGRGFDRSN